MAGGGVGVEGLRGWGAGGMNYRPDNEVGAQLDNY